MLNDRNHHIMYFINSCSGWFRHLDGGKIQRQEEIGSNNEKSS